MKFTVEREHLLKPLQQVSGPLGGRPTLPILGNLLLQVSEGALSLTGTDLEMEMVARVALMQPHETGATTVPARKFFDICRGLPEGAEIAVQLEGDRMLVRSGRSRFSLSTLPAADFPNLDDWQSEVEFTLPQATMKRLIEATQFSMAHQDVRYYLNGMLFETEGDELRTVATDGHRLAVCSMPLGESLPNHSVIVPRKGVIELMRMLDGGDTPLRVQIGSNNIRPTSVTSSLHRSWLTVVSLTTAACCRRIRISIWMPAAISSSRRLPGRQFSQTRSSAACAFT
ncbi:DNA polymerase III subunit beta [Raoultella terrigena]|uniref:Beta sliding clamp n=1 Tax=Raoultella terrigena TaxID=577 RepID=A0A7Z9CP36_RAOTE|nr:DNA polymerase III subunit beta [Raoultella terrigena]